MKSKLLLQLIMLSKNAIYGILLQTLLFNFIWAADTNAQEVKSVNKVEVNLDLRNASLIDVFRKIESQTNFVFSYINEELDRSYRITRNYNRATLSSVLLEISRDANLKFKQVNNNINVTKLGEKVPVNEIEVVIQTRNITGKVTSYEDGEGIPGVNVVEKGTSNGTVTDVQGNYSLEVSEGATLVFSSVGYTQEEVIVGNQSVIDLTMTQDIQQLQELVVIGYGQQEKKDLTGSVSSISADKIKAVPMTSFDQALQGRAPGVLVRQNSGELDGSFNVQIRGVASTGNTQPLYVVDGVPLFSGSLSNFDPDIIESIEVLKDGSATAIYGARAANGVVIVTTKSGTYNESNLSFTTDIGWQSPTRLIDMMNSADLYQAFEDAFERDGRGFPPDGGYIPDGFFDENGDPVADYNWQELMTRTAPWQKYTLTYTDGTDKNQLAISGSYMNRQGILIETDLKRATLTANADHCFTNKFKIGIRLNGSSQWGNGTTNDLTFGSSGLRNAIYSKPWFPYKDDEGNLIEDPNRGVYGGVYSNPVLRRKEQIDQRNSSRFLGSIYGEYEILEGLKYKALFGSDLLFVDSYFFLPKIDRGGNLNRQFTQITEGESRQFNWLTDHTLTWDKILSENHNINLLLGFSAQKFISEFSTIQARGSTNNDLRYLSNQTEITNFSGFPSEASLLSYFSRVNYSFKDKYLLTATIRRDGSSKFGPGNRYGTFPSGSIGWRISEESFMENADFINDLKLRASYGETGNQNIGDFRFISRAAGANYVWGNQLAEANIPLNYANRDLKWESSIQSNIGIDATLFNGRINLVADYYNKESEGLLVTVPISPTAGVIEGAAVNLGNIRNSGFELGISSVNIDKQFKWTTDFNISTNKNEVLDIGTDPLGNPARIFGPSPLLFGSVNLTTAGHPLGAFYGYEFIGIWQEEEAEEANSFGSFFPGTVKYKDRDGDGKFTPDDRTFIGNPYPDWYGGLNNTFSYKGLSLSIFMNWSVGNDIYNSERLFTEFGGFAFAARSNMNNAWTPENRSNIMPGFTANNPGATRANLRHSSRVLEDGSFLRFSSINLAYRLPENILEPINLKAATLSLIGSNLITISNYSGFDPEASSGNGPGGANNPLSPGLDITPYPIAKSFLLRLNVEF